jgi:flagellar motor switch protein FliG
MSDTETDLLAFTGPQKAAILIMYLDRDVSKHLLSLLSNDEVRSVGFAMAEIKHISQDEIHVVVEEFLEKLNETTMVSHSGNDFLKTVLPNLVDDERKNTIIPVIHRRYDSEFIDFISNRQPGAVAALLKEEQTQVQSVALALMGSDNAANVLRFMDQHRQAEVTMRMSKLKQIPGDLADDIKNAIRDALGAEDDNLEVGGIDKTARILGRMHKRDQTPILGAVEDEDSELAEKLRRRMVVFDDLMQLDKRDMQTLLKSIEKDELLRALKGANPQMVEHFLASVSKRQAEDLREELEIMGAVQRSRIRSSQESIVAEALKLAENGKIFLDIGAPDDDDEDY